MNTQKLASSMESSKLTLNRETLRSLDRAEILAVQGAAPDPCVSKPRCCMSEVC